MNEDPELLATITATTKTTLDDDLNTAVRAAELVAQCDGRRGVLVTRVDYASFTVELSPDVPYGFTYEKQRF
ncbi:hypothetical protein [Pseudarthrobacter sp. Y6]|uniref:hypothetical protein n=1 Tax=Pseudarthrobacter sp. Y6 TaxID=3418422 RepID=UPI003CF1413F